MIEPLNPDNDSLFDIGNLTIIGDNWDAQLEQISELEENDPVTLTWRNATIIVRAGTARAWIEMATTL